jgi:hypothetical protein
MRSQPWPPPAWPSRSEDQSPPRSGLDLLGLTIAGTCMMAMSVWLLLLVVHGDDTVTVDDGQRRHVDTVRAYALARDADEAFQRPYPHAKVTGDGTRLGMLCPASWHRPPEILRGGRA